MRRVCLTGGAGFTLMEVLIALAVLSTAFVALITLQSQSLNTIDRLTQRLEADVWADDAVARFKLTQEGYNIEPVHPLMQDRRRDWRVETERMDLDLDDLPFVPVLPVGWQAEWIQVLVIDADGDVLAEVRPLWAYRAAP